MITQFFLFLQLVEVFTDFLAFQLRLVPFWYRGVIFLVTIAEIQIT